jgi:HSP20 family protein
MTSLIRRDPFETPVVNRLFNHLFNDPFFGDMPRFGFSLATPVEEGTLALDISEDDRNVIVRASLPGFAKEDIDVEIHDGVLVIKAEHAEEKEEKGETFYRKERRVGSMSRRVALPSTVVEGETKAELKDGVLTLRLPKVSKPTPKKVKIG